MSRNRRTKIHVIYLIIYQIHQIIYSYLLYTNKFVLKIKLIFKINIHTYWKKKMDFYIRQFFRV